MGYLVAARLHDQPLDLPHFAVGRTDGQLAAYVYLAVGDEVDSDLLRALREYGGQLEPVPGGVLMPGGVEVRDSLGVLGASKRLELR
ncbi:MAG TPA: hypothetical protein VF070_15130 [Streptosporangiaceae bacterium]